MDVRGLLIELFGRIREHVDGAVIGLSPEELVTVPEPGCNPVGWLVWHLTRVQDDHLAELLAEQQVWVGDGGWPARFGLEPDPMNTGYGHTPAEVAAVRPVSAEALVGYYGAVAARTNAFLERVTAADLDRIVDPRWDPPVTLGVRLVSVADDDIQHAGQARYVRGLLARRGHRRS
jgi:uncharacterized damage-inducible protein DinB